MPFKNQYSSAHKENLVYGVGINDSTERVQYINKLGALYRCPFHLTWSGIVRRCYDDTFRKKHPTYAACTMVEEWHYFSTFKLWMKQQDWKNKQIDKDIIIPDNKRYSPDTCCFVSSKLNMLLVTKPKKKYPMGVCYVASKRKYKAYISDRGKTKHIGYFFTIKNAHSAFLNSKAEIIMREANKQTDYKIYGGLVLHANNHLLSGGV